MNTKSCLALSSRGGGGTPLYKVYRYVPPQRVWFLSRFGLKTGIDFDSEKNKSINYVIPAYFYSVKTSDKLCLQGPPWQNKSTGSCSEGSNQQKNCKAYNLKKEQGWFHGQGSIFSKIYFPDREINLALFLDYMLYFYSLRQLPFGTDA